ncbi:MAG TPA: transposase [Streptomyces sp.]
MPAPPAPGAVSVPGIAPCSAARFLAAVGGSLDDFDSPDALAALAGPAGPDP